MFNSSTETTKEMKELSVDWNGQVRRTIDFNPNKNINNTLC